MQAMQSLSQNHNFERSLQGQAIGATPALANADYTNISQLMGMGQFQQQQQQAQLGDNQTRWNAQQQQPIQNLQTLNQILQGGMQLSGQQSSTNSSQNSNPFASLFGTAAMGAGLYGNIAGGAAAGTGLGGMLSGLFDGGLGDAIFGALPFVI
jgi:hypothetical protein